jgi:UDP-GlcNAc:undecaprenyl-phosphate GlcNAc-1-phosphate transferase
MPFFSPITLQPLATAILISFFLTPIAIKIAFKLKMVDDPAKHKHPKVIHKYPVPRGGGMIMFTAILASSLIFLPLDKHLIGILLGAFLITLLGLFDDKFDLNPYIRLGLQLAIAAIPIGFGIGIAFIKVPWAGIIDLSQPRISFTLFGDLKSIWLLSDLFAVFWTVYMMNMLNMGAKGVDGQLPGVVAIAALTIAALSLRYSADITQWPVIILALITAGAYLGFLPWNFYPQKIMPSYSGSTLAGYILAMLSILSTAKVGTLFIALGVPLIDTGYTIVRRILNGRSPVWGDRGHLHHRLLDIGWSKSKVAVFYWAITALLGFLALYLNASQKFYTIIGVAVLLGGLILWLTYRSKVKD